MRFGSLRHRQTHGDAGDDNAVAKQLFQLDERRCVGDLLEHRYVVRAHAVIAKRMGPSQNNPDTSVAYGCRRAITQKRSVDHTIDAVWVECSHRFCHRVAARIDDIGAESSKKSLV
jgi:hypothetical protein